MDLLLSFGTERALDLKLDALAAPILEAIHTNPKSLEFEQLVDGLRLVRGPDPRDINASCIRVNDTTVIHVGRGLYEFLQSYTRCAATKFLPSEPDGPRPSSAWPAAVRSLTATLEWYSLPFREVRYATFPVGPGQDNRATIFSNMTYRATICHEIAHAVLGHLKEEESEAADPGLDASVALINGRERELQADAFGMRLNLDSLSHSEMTVTAAAALIYNVHATNLLRYRLMMLAQIVDASRWERLVRHPDPLARNATLAATAEKLYGSGLSSGMLKVHYELEAIDGAIRSCHTEMRDLVESEVLSLAAIAGGASQAGQQLNELLERSPVGVIRALDVLQADHESPTLAAELASTLPRPVQRFIALPFSDRARRVLNKAV